MKNRKVWFGSAIALTLMSIGVAFAKPFNFIDNFFRVRAATYTDSSITFDTSGMQRSGTTTTITSRTQTGGVIICKIFDNDATTLNNYNNIIGAPKLGSFIRFYESDGVTEYTFEDLQQIGFAYDNSFGFYLHTVNADGTTTKYGKPYTTSTSSVTRYINFTSYPDVAQIAVEATNTGGAISKLKSIEIIYNCTTKYQTGISITTAPDKTSYFEGESFDRTGMVVKLLYSNNIQVATNSYSVYQSGPFTTSDTYVTISYGGYSTTQAITVGENTYIGTYIYTSGSSTNTIVLNGDMTGYYRYVNTLYSYDITMHFTWDVSGTTITFTKDKQPGDTEIDGGSSFNLFTISGSYNTTNTGTIKASGDINIYTCSNTTRNSTAKTCIKQ